jgi:hypothetical protein
MGQLHDPCKHCWHQVPTPVTAATPLIPAAVCCYCGEQRQMAVIPTQMYHGPYVPKHF